MFRCECGSEEFYAHDSETIVVHYDNEGNEVDGGEIMDAERPAWNKAFHCSSCDKEYSSIPAKDHTTEWLESRKRRYLEHSSCCPICECDDIEGGSLQADGNQVWQDINCLECHAEWTDIYYLRQVEIKNFPTNLVPDPPVITDPNRTFKEDK